MSISETAMITWLVGLEFTYQNDDNRAAEADPSEDEEDEDYESCIEGDIQIVANADLKASSIAQYIEENSLAYFKRLNPELAELEEVDNIVCKVVSLVRQPDPTFMLTLSN